MPRWLAPDEADNGDIVVLRDLTNFTLGDARQVEHYDASAVERNEHLPRRDVGDTSLDAKDARTETDAKRCAGHWCVGC